MKPKLKRYKAEIISIGEWRWYEAPSISHAVEMAAEEFGVEDIGRVIKVVE